MKSRRKPESFKNLTQKQWEDWNHTIFSLFLRLWVVILSVQLLLFVFYEPTAECPRIPYFKHYVILPSALEAIILLLFYVIFVKLFPSYRRRIVSLYTILLITAFAGITLCVHTSVTMLQAMLLLPMMLTPLYKDRWMTLLQAALVVFLYILDYFYVIPNAAYILPDNWFKPYINLIVFVAGTMATCMILERVNITIVLNEERSNHDSLTHLYNHENFYMELEYYRNQFEATGKGFSILIADIDNFKKVNDTFGHAFGDEVIRKVGELFADAGKKDGFCARYGGEEFAMILPHTNPVPTAEQIRKAFESYDFDTPEGIQHFTVSIGAAVYDKAYPNGSTFFETADAALYHAKQHGKNQVVLSGTYDENN